MIPYYFLFPNCRGGGGGGGVKLRFVKKNHHHFNLSISGEFPTGSIYYPPPPSFSYFVLEEPQTWKPSRGVVCYVQSERVNLSFSLIAQTDIQVLRENL